MTETELYKYIEELSQRGSVLGLTPVKELAKRMGEPEKDLKILHLAGTNGKGSILAYVSTILQTCGYRVGRYISPVLTEYREKIQVNEKFITKKALCEGMEEIKSCIESMEQEGLPLPTIFEVETVLAFWYFKKKHCDFVVLETGLGGEEDATNYISSSLMSIFASISMDHMGILGNTLSEIAEKKAGIIKPGGAVVSIPQLPEAAQVLEAKARKVGAELIYAQRPQNIKYGLMTQSFTYEDFGKCKISIAGVVQPENAAVALEVVKHLRRIGYKLPMEQVKLGLENTKWLGRCTVLRKKPLLLMDGAHNADAARRLRETIELTIPNTPLIFIMGVLRDKEYEKVLEYTADLASHIVTLTPPENPRALTAYELAQVAKKYCPQVSMADSVEEALEIASLLAGQECGMIAFGSLSYLGRFQKAVDLRYPKAKPKK